MHVKRTLIVFLVAILFISTVASALVLSGCSKKEGVAWLREPSGAPVQKIPDDKKLTFDDVLYAEYVSEMAISPAKALFSSADIGILPSISTCGNDTRDYAVMTYFLADHLLSGIAGCRPFGSQLYIETFSSPNPLLQAEL
jgi:hypothetical protein